MKKYIIPVTEAQELVRFAGIICHSRDGEGSQENPNDPSGGGKLNAPMKWVF